METTVGPPTVYFISESEERLPSVYFISESGEVGKDTKIDAKAGQPEVYFVSEAGAVNEVCILEISAQVLSSYGQTSCSFSSMSV